MFEVHDIFVRAHTVVPQKERRQQPSPAKWPEEVLVFDTETTVDTVQKLNFGAYRRCQLSPAGYQCVDEGLFYADDLDTQQREVLQRYVDDPRNLPRLDIKMFPPPMRMKLYSRSDFVERVLWKAMRNGAMIVGFNLPFDISRLAVKSSPAADEGWSFVLSVRKSRKTGEMEINPERPRVVIASKDSRVTFIRLRDIFRPKEWPWPREGRFLDLYALGWALRNEAHDLDSWCAAFNVCGKMKHKPTGRVTFEEINYCRRDVQATANLLNAMKREFDQHRIELLPDKAKHSAHTDKSEHPTPARQLAIPTSDYRVPSSADGP